MESCSERIKGKKCQLTLELKSFKLQVKGKRKIIPKSNCAKNETVDINILILSWMVDRKIMQPIRITSGIINAETTKWNKLSQFRCALPNQS